jgi:small basic protein
MELSVLAIVLSILIGVVTNLLTPHISTLFARLSKSIKAQNDKKKVIFANSVQYLLDNPHQEVIFKIDYMQTIIVQSVLLFFAVYLMLSERLIIIMTGFLLSMATYYSILRINNRRKIGEELIKRRKTSHPEIDLS